VISIDASWKFLILTAWLSGGELEMLIGMTAGLSFNKGTELYNIISSSSPEIIIGTETHLDPTYNNAEILPYDIPSSYQYKIYRKDRKELIQLLFQVMNLI
jgi:hypothetical protein